MKYKILLCLSFYLVLLYSSCSDKEEMTKNPDPNPNCVQDGCWDADIFTCRDQFYIDIFTRSTEWTGGDATYSIDLKDGRRLWLFGDTFIGQVNPDRSRPSTNLIRNSMVLQRNNQFTTIQGGTSSRPKPFLTPVEKDWWYWPGDGLVKDGKVYVFMQGFTSTASGSFGFKRTSIDLATLNYNTLEVENVNRLFSNAEIAWGTALVDDNDYIYIYGVKSLQSNKEMYVARVKGSLGSEWEYYSNDKWAKEGQLATPIFSGVSEQFAVFKDGAKYYLVTQELIFGKKIYLYSSSKPEGDFTNQKVIYCTPETKGDIFTYNAYAHPTVYADSLLVSYNVNSFEASDLLKSADNYRPYFVKVGDWRN